MALLFADAFGSGDTSAWFSATDATVTPAAALFTGYGCRFVVDGSNNNVTRSLEAQSELHVRAWVRLPTNTDIPLNSPVRLTGGLGGTLDIYIQRTSTGLQARGDCYGATGSYTAIPKWYSGTWNALELYAERNAGAETAFLKINDRLVARLTPGNTADNFGIQVGAVSGDWGELTDDDNIDIAATEVYDAEHSGAWRYAYDDTGSIIAMWRRRGRWPRGNRR